MASRITWRSGIPIMLAAALITACGSAQSDNQNNGGATTCSMTLSGAQTGTATCTAGHSYLTRTDGHNGASSFQFFTSGTPKMSAFFKIPGPVANGTFEFSRGTFGSVELANGKSKWFVEDGPSANV